jgi:Protein of unknown function (DUF1501)
MFQSRRDFLRQSACGFGYLALAGLAAQQASAKRVIFLFMQGAPSHVDTFDYKPALAKFNGKEDPVSKGKSRKLLESPFKFNPAGQSGIPISELFPYVSKHADKMCVINSMVTDVPNHPQAAVQLHTGNFQFVRPSMGAWVLYGLGTENQELPGFITLNPLANIGGAQNYGSAFLPASFQGTKIGEDRGRIASAKLANISNPRIAAEAQRRQLDLLREFNQERLAADQVNNPLEGVIESYELAFRMQGAVPKVMDFAEESAATLAAYGINDQPTDNFGRQCLLARRFAEAGVRFIEVSLGGWDQHNSLKEQLTRNANAIDKPIGALLNDLEQRGMLKDTLVLWGGEFGRTPGAQNENGRDHNATGYSMWMAGGGVKGGLRYGSTDEFGHNAVENKMHIHDLHATMLHMMGLDHTKLTYRYSGRDFRLTDVHGEIHKGILAS